MKCGFLKLDKKTHCLVLKQDHALESGQLEYRVCSDQKQLLKRGALSLKYTS